MLAEDGEVTVMVAKVFSIIAAASFVTFAVLVSYLTIACSGGRTVRARARVEAGACFLLFSASGATSQCIGR